MATHLGHKLPWESLAKSLHTESRGRFGQYTHVTTDSAGVKAIRHFARCLATQIAEFAASDKTPIEERRALHPEHNNWPGWHTLHGFGGHLGYCTSVLSGYVALNLLLLDEQKFVPIIRPDDCWEFRVCCGDCDGGHPDFLAEPFKLLYETWETKRTREQETKDAEHKRKVKPRLEEHLIPELVGMVGEYLGGEADSGEVRELTLRELHAVLTGGLQRSSECFKPLDTLQTQRMQERAKMFFRILYTLHGLGHEYDEEHIVHHMCEAIGLSGSEF
jgi:hypothetical protein